MADARLRHDFRDASVLIEQATGSDSIPTIEEHYRNDDGLYHCVFPGCRHTSHSWRQFRHVRLQRYVALIVTDTSPRGGRRRLSTLIFRALITCRPLTLSGCAIAFLSFQGRGAPAMFAWPLLSA